MDKSARRYSVGGSGQDRLVRSGVELKCLPLITRLDVIAINFGRRCTLAVETPFGRAAPFDARAPSTTHLSVYYSLLDFGRGSNEATKPR